MNVFSFTESPVKKDIQLPQRAIGIMGIPAVFQPQHPPVSTTAGTRRHPAISKWTPTPILGPWILTRKP